MWVVWLTVLSVSALLVLSGGVLGIWWERRRLRPILDSMARRIEAQAMLLARRAERPPGGA